MADDQYVLFSLNEQIFGIAISKVREVLSYRAVTPLPGAEGIVQGVINLRGIILPVFELRYTFHLPVAEYTSFHVIIVVETAGRVVGFITDAIVDVLEVLPEELQNANDFPPGLRREFLLGIGKKEERMILLLNVDQLLSSEELAFSES